MDRILLFSIIVLLLVIAFGILRRWQLRHVARQAAADPLLSDLHPDVPTIVYFTSPYCGPCQTRQKPALRALQDDLGEGVQIVEVNALEDPDAARRWGVLSVPTTFILDGRGMPREVNYGVAGVEKLKRQLQKVSGGKHPPGRILAHGSHIGTH